MASFFKLHGRSFVSISIALCQTLYLCKGQHKHWVGLLGCVSTALIALDLRLVWLAESVSFSLLVMRGQGLPRLRQMRGQLQFSSQHCSTEGEHLVAVSAHWTGQLVQWGRKATLLLWNWPNGFLSARNTPLCVPLMPFIRRLIFKGEYK